MENNQTGAAAQVAVLLLAAVFIAGGALYFYYNDMNGQTRLEDANMPADADTMTETDGREEDGSKKDGNEALIQREIAITAKNFSFNPNEIRVKRNETVKLVLINEQGFHDLVVDELNVRTKQISANAEESVIFTPRNAGTYEYYCSVGLHRQQGMVGKIIVE